MRKLTRCILSCSLLLAAHLALGQAELHEWTNQSGQTIQAKFVRGDEETVILFLNGRNYAYQLDDLGEESRELARKLIREAAASPQQPLIVSEGFPQKGKGERRGYNATEIKRALDEHNRLRREVGSPELKWDPELARQAQAWAEVMAREQSLEHSEGNDEGENISWAKGYDRSRCIGIALQGWGEKEKAIYLSVGEPVAGGKNFRGVGHYTQMVWWKTTRVGMATARAADGSYYTCARYAPAGNVVGQHPYPQSRKRR